MINEKDVPPLKHDIITILAKAYDIPRSSLNKPTETLLQKIRNKIDENQTIDLGLDSEADLDIKDSDSKDNAKPDTSKSKSSTKDNAEPDTPEPESKRKTRSSRAGVEIPKDAFSGEKLMSLYAQDVMNNCRNRFIFRHSE